MIPFRLYLYAAAALAIGFLLWREHHLVKKVNALVAERNQAVANLTTERAARVHEQKIATEASHDYETRLQALNVARADTPVRTVRLCRSPTGYVPAPADTASGVDAAPANGLPEAAGFHPGYGSTDRFSDAGPDIGPELYRLADEADEAVARCGALQGWVKAR